MDLALPRFDDSGDRSVRPHQPGIAMTDSPAPVRLMGHLRSPSPCLNLDALSSDESDEPAGAGDISASPICISDDCSTPVNPDLVLSDEDLPSAACARDWRQVIRICDVPPDVQVVGLAQICDTPRAVWGYGRSDRSSE